MGNILCLPLFIMTYNINNKYCFLVVIEDTEIFWSQLKLLLFSFRKNVQKYKNSKFWVLVNDGKVEQSKIKYLQNQFHPLEIVQQKSEINFIIKRHIIIKPIENIMPIYTSIKLISLIE